MINPPAGNHQLYIRVDGSGYTKFAIHLSDWAGVDTTSPNTTVVNHTYTDYYSQTLSGPWIEVPANGAAFDASQINNDTINGGVVSPSIEIFRGVPPYLSGSASGRRTTSGSIDWTGTSMGSGRSSAGIGINPEPAAAGSMPGQRKFPQPILNF